MAPSTRTHRSRQTRYREIERYLRTLVEGAGPGDPLPSEAELCERFSVSRMTVRQALAERTNDGLVERRRGQGTFVAHRPVHRRPGVFLSFTEEMNRRGAQATSRLLSSGLDDARRAEALDLGLAPDSQLVRIRRVRLADGVPAKRGTVATRAVGTITARLARASETELLDLAPQAALLVELRILFDQEGRAFERTETRHAPD